MVITDEALRLRRQEEFRRGAVQRVKLMSAEQKAELQPVADWMAQQIEKLKAETR